MLGTIAVGLNACVGNADATSVAEGIGLDVGVGAQALTSSVTSNINLRRMILTPNNLCAEIVPEIAGRLEVGGEARAIRSCSTSKWVFTALRILAYYTTIEVNQFR